MIEANSVMKKILKENKQISNLDTEVNKLCQKILNQLNLIHESVLFNINEKEAKKLDFDYLLTRFGDLSYFEWYNNEILIPNEVITNNKILQFSIKIKKELELKFENKKICVVMDIDLINDIKLLRFHVYRKNDGLIVSNINEIKENAILLLL